MKKVLAIALMLLIPCAAFAMETMTVDEMAEITGQSGVAIALDDVKVFFYTQNEETWYQSAGNLTAASNVHYHWRGALGLIRSDFGQMLYVNAMLMGGSGLGGSMATAAGNFSSIGSAGGTEPNMKRQYMLTWTNPLGGTAGNQNYMGLNQYYGFSFGNVSLDSTGAGTNRDRAYDPKSLTIRAVNRAEVFSYASWQRLGALQVMGQLNAPGYAGYDAINAPTSNVRVAAVVIGLPTAEIHYKRARGEVLEIALSVAPDPLTRVGNLLNDSTNTDTWSFGKIYYGGWAGPNAPTTPDKLQTRTILVLDGFIEITPMEQFMRPNVH